MWKEAVHFASGDRDVDVLVGNVQRSVLNRDTLDYVDLGIGLDIVQLILIIVGKVIRRETLSINLVHLTGNILMLL